jgi:hypothetical protein
LSDGRISPLLSLVLVANHIAAPFHLRRRETSKVHTPRVSRAHKAYDTFKFCGRLHQRQRRFRHITGTDGGVGRVNGSCDIHVGIQGYGRQTVSRRSSSKSVALRLSCNSLEACNPATPVMLLITLPSFDSCHADHEGVHVSIDAN